MSEKENFEQYTNMAIEDPQISEVMNPDNEDKQSASDTSALQKEPTQNEHQTVIMTAEMLFSLHGLEVTLPVSCDFCPKKFHDMDLFDAHMITHKECRFFSCQLCSNTYMSWGNLVAHRMACHRGEVLNCDTCGKRKYHPGLGPVNFPVDNYPIGCEECGEGFTTVNQLYRHYRIRGTHQLMPIEEGLTKVNQVLERHEHAYSLAHESSPNLVVMVAGEKRYQCERCPKLFKAKKGLKQHTYMHPVHNDYRCQCGEKFTEWDDMCNHMHTDHANSDLTCVICNETLTAVDEFLVHYRECHIDSENQEITTRRSNVTCPVCHKVFSRPTALHRHQKLHNPLTSRHVCEKCGEVITRRKDVLEHARGHYGDVLPEKYNKLEEQIAKERKYREGVKSRKSFICEYCGREFNKKLNLQLHVRRHTGDKPYGCQLCGKAFYTNQQLAIHVRRHTGERPYSCGMCSKTFTGPTALYVHRNLHNRVKRYLCPHCGKRFVWRSSFLGHVRLHTGERPYKCTICNKGFTLKGKLNFHLKKHASEHAIPSCSDCGEHFSSEAELNAHRDEQCCMTMVTFVEEGPSGEKDTKILVMNPEDLEKNNIYIDNSAVVHLVVE